MIVSSPPPTTPQNITKKLKSLHFTIDKHIFVCYNVVYKSEKMCPLGGDPLRTFDL